MINSITGRDIPLYTSFKEELYKAKEVKIIVSFLRESGVKLIVKDLKKQALKGAKITVITGRYLNITEPSALSLLKFELGNMVDLRFFDKDNISFHPKAYFFKNDTERVLFIGSSNISYSALQTGVEWNYRLVDYNDTNSYDRFEKKFDRLLSEETIVIDDDVLSS